MLLALNRCLCRCMSCCRAARLLYQKVGNLKFPQITFSAHVLITNPSLDRRLHHPFSSPSCDIGPPSTANTPTTINELLSYGSIDTVVSIHSLTSNQPNSSHPPSSILHVIDQKQL